VSATEARPAVDLELLAEVGQFIYREARLQDEHEYDAWEALWTDDAIYWVPSGGQNPDPEKQVSIIFDNRSRISTRVKQFHTGRRHSQNPPSDLRRTVSNIEITAVEGDEYSVGANFVVYESRERGITTWAGRSEYVLRRVDGELMMARKKVVLVGNDRPIYTLAFLI
jgi:3-phenylpropionate/cinnamic acid dioxygenase small subunit